MITANPKFKYDDIVFYRKAPHIVIRATITCVRLAIGKGDAIFTNYDLVEGSNEYVARDYQLFSTAEEAFK